MTEALAIVGLFILLFGIVALRFCFLLNDLKDRDEKERNWDDKEWFDAECIRHSKYYED